MAAELLLLRQAEFLVGGAGGEDDGRSLVGLAGAGDHALEVAGEVDLGDVVEHHLRAERSACCCSPSISSGPWMPPGKPGKFSTSVVFISAPPAVTDPARTSGFRPARAA